MPISPDFKWQESEDWVNIDVTLRTVKPATADITTTECFVKVNSYPFLFQVDLAGEVDTKESSGVVDQDGVHFYLVKKEQGLWGRLAAVGGKKEIMARRQRSLDAIRELSQQEKKVHGEKISKIKRIAVEKQMNLDEARRKTIERRKADEMHLENVELAEWKNQLVTENPRALEDAQRELVDLNYEDKIDVSEKLQYEALRREYSRHNFEPPGSEALKCPAPLKKGKVRFADEMENIASEVSVQKDVELPLKENIKQCHDDEREAGDDLSLNISSTNGISSTANATVRVEPKVVLRERQAVESIEKVIPAPRKPTCISIAFSDKPTLPDHLPARESREVKVELKDRTTEAPDTTDVSYREPIFLQDKGDQFFKAGDYRSATNAYSDAISKDAAMILWQQAVERNKDSNLVLSLEKITSLTSDHDSCYANRAACRLHLKQAQACVDDSTTAVHLLNSDENIFDLQVDIANVACPEYVKRYRDNPSEGLGLLTCLTRQRTSGNDIWSLKNSVMGRLLTRRGTAHCLLGDLQKAVDDFASALNLFPNNKDVECSLKEMRARVETNIVSSDVLVLDSEVG